MILPILEPATSQKRCRLLPFSFFSRTSRTSAEPLRAITAMSEVGSRSGSTAAACFVYVTRPSRNGGRVSCTIRIARTSSSLVKSVSTCGGSARQGRLSSRAGNEQQQDGAGPAQLAKLALPSCSQGGQLPHQLWHHLTDCMC